MSVLIGRIIKYGALFLTLVASSEPGMDEPIRAGKAGRKA